MDKRAIMIIVVFSPHKNNPELRKRLSEYPDQYPMTESTTLLAVEGTNILKEFEHVLNEQDKMYVFNIGELQCAHPKREMNRIKEWIFDRRNPDFGNAKYGMTV